MSNADLSHVDPRRLAETKRRITIVSEYAAIERPTGDDTKRFTDLLGLSTSQLIRFVRLWHKDGRLPGREHWDQRSKAVKTSRHGISETSIETVKKAVNDFGLDARFTDLSEAARKACLSSGVEAPSPASIWLIIRKMRDQRDSLAAKSRRGILIARCRLKIKVQFGKSASMPEVLIAVVLPECRVIDTLIISPTAKNSGFADFTASLTALIGRDNGRRPLLADDISTGMGRLPANIILENSGTPAFNMLIEAIGRKLDTLPIVPVTRNNMPARVNEGATLTPDQARDAIAHAIERHNRAKP